MDIQGTQMDKQLQMQYFLLQLGQRLKDLANYEIKSPAHYYFVGFPLFFFGGIFFLFDGYFFKSICAMGAIFMAIGFIKDVISLIKILLEIELSKLVVGGILGTLIALPAIIIANHTINDITGLDPTFFKFSLTIFSIVFGFYTAFLLIFISLIIFYNIYFFRLLMYPIKFFAAMMKSMLLLEDEKPRFFNKKEIIEFTRPLGAMIISAGVIYGIAHFDKHFLTLKQWGTVAIVLTDFYPKSSCDDLTNYDRVLRINDNIYIIASPIKDKEFEWTFKKKKC